MSRVNEPKCKKCRRNKEKLFLKGNRCLTAKCSLEKRNFPPGKNSVSIIKKSSEYGVRLREKQKLKFFYCISEVQLKKYYKKADMSHEITGVFLLSLCERRLDNLIYRAKFAFSRKEARLMVSHGHILVNNKKVDIASYIVKSKDIISFKDNIKPIIIKRNEELKSRNPINWISVNEKECTFEVIRVPLREEIDIPIQEQLVVEYYSR